MNDKIIITNHAYDKAKERLRLSKKSFERLVHKAVFEGLTIADVSSGELYNYIICKTKMQRAQKDDRIDIRIYGENMYIFANSYDQLILLTVYQLPNNMKREALQIINMKKLTLVGV